MMINYRQLNVLQYYKKLNDACVTDDDYIYAKNVWQSFNVKTLGEYSDIYRRTDIIHLADVFENFRETALATYALASTWYYSMHGYTWDTMLK